MKTLVLLRHAKSSWDYPVDDIDRPLSFNGIRRIKKMVNNNKNIFNLSESKKEEMLTAVKKNLNLMKENPLKSLLKEIIS